MNMNVNGFVVVVVVLQFFCMFISASVVFKVQHKFSGNNNMSMTNYTDHDYYRHQSVTDLPIGATPFMLLHFTKIQIGTPPRYYYVEVDTGSNLLWVNCVGCQNCSIDDGYLRVSFPKYDPKLSSSSTLITCDQEFCTSTPASYMSDCNMGMQCPYIIGYNDGSSTTGYFVRDMVKLNGVSGNFQTENMTGSINFGCGTQQFPKSSEFLQSHTALGGVLGLGPSNYSVIWQLASAKTVKKTFSHCLSVDQPKGGIFVIGEPKVNTTPVIMPKGPLFTSHYTIELKAIEVGHVFINVSTNVANNSASKREASIDIGTSISYFPNEIHTKLMDQIFANNPLAKKLMNEGGRMCNYAHDYEKIYDSMPIVTFHFAYNLKLKVYPHQHMVLNHRCIGFMSNAVLPEGNDHLILLGDALLTDKLVTYNMEDETIGWTEYNCSSSIKVKDEQTGRVYDVDYHNLYPEILRAKHVGVPRLFLYFSAFPVIVVVVVFFFVFSFMTM